MTKSRKGLLTLAVVTLCVELSGGNAFGQSNALWSGSAQCTVTEQDQTYQRQEVQTWALTGAAPTQQGAMQIYPATWTDTGTGQLVRVQGPQTNNTAWQTNAQGSASIAFWIRASDGRLIVSARHARQSVYGGISATRQMSVNGVAQSATPLNQTVSEWIFPRIEADASASVVDGSAQSPSEALPADFVHRFGSTAPLAACQWHFAKGGMSSANQNPNGMGGTQNSNQQNPTLGNSGNKGQNCQTPATVQQSFETMKSQLQAQYDQLIRGTTDATEIAALHNQEQKMLASLTNQEQRDMALAAQGCLPPSNTSTNTGSTTPPPSGGSQNPTTTGAGGQTQTTSGNSGTSGTGAQGNQNQTGSGTPTASVSLTTASGGTGTGVIAMTPTGTPCGANCAQYTPGTAVTVIAVPNNGSSFTSFSGGGCASVNPCSFTITAPTIVAAAFNLNGQTTSTGTTGATPSGTTAQTGVNPTGTGSTGSTSTTNSTMTRPPVSGVNVKPTTGVVKTTGTKTTPGSSGGSSTPPAPSSASYRVTLTGLLCTRAITENGDAVYAAAVVRQYDRRSGQSTMLTNVNTWTYGNVNGMQDQRKQAGSRSAMGGIGVGDTIPPGFVPGIPVTLPPQPNVFPMGLWEGTLTDGIDAVVISPSVWIVYGDRSLFSTWNQNEDSLTNSIYLDPAVQSQISNQTLGNVNDGTSTNAPGGTANNAASTAYFASGEPMIITTGIIVQLLSHPGTDRPLGLIDASTSSVVLPNATLVLTREIIEKSLGNRSWTLTAIDLKDTAKSLQNSYPGSDRAGEYTVFIQIERTSGSGNPVASSTPSSSQSSSTSSTATATASASPNVTTTQAPSGGTPSIGTSGFRSAPNQTAKIIAVIKQVSPAAAVQGQTGLNVTIIGQNTHFVQGQTKLSFGTGITVSSPTVTSPTSASALLNVDALSPPQARTVQVTTGTETVSLANGFSVNPSASITQVNPATAEQGQSGVSVTITGQNTHFVQGQTAMNFGDGVALSSLTVSSPSSATAILNVYPLSPAQAKTVQATTGTEVATLVNGFSVTQSSSPFVLGLQHAKPLGQADAQYSSDGQAITATTDDFYVFTSQAATCNFVNSCTDHRATVSVTGFPAGSQVKLTLYWSNGGIISTTVNSSPTQYYSSSSADQVYIEVQLLGPPPQYANPQYPNYYTLTVQES